MSEKKKKILAMKVAPYTLINRFLYKLGPDEVLRRFVLEREQQDIVEKEHSTPARGHYQADMIVRKVCNLTYGSRHYINIVEYK